MRTWVEQLIAEYNDIKKQLEAYRSSLDRADPDGEKNSDLVGSMISSLQYGITHMQTGRRPGSYRGIDKRSVYNQLAYMDIYPSLKLEPEDDSIDDERKRKLINILLSMSDRERQCYLLHMSQGLSYAKIGEEMKISRNTVRTFVERAKSKIQQGL